jgi:ribosomal peptide maturation radical SAM protein 1
MIDTPTSVLFVVVPFLPEHQPALGVSSLLAVLRDKGMRGRVSYLNLAYRQRIGPDLYFLLSRAVPPELLLGEMIFARALWGENAASWESYVERFLPAYETFARQVPRGLDEQDALSLQAETWSAVADRLRQMHDEAPALTEAWADAIIDEAPSVVAFTSTFQQNAAALALARAIRRRVPREAMPIIFGGANCEADMGRALADNFAVIDAVHSGEGEAAIDSLLDRVRSADHTTRFSAGPSITDLDALPVPAFDDYFDAIAGTDLEAKANLVAESSRGCWWGAKSHCTFCGLNGTTMAYRSKTPARFTEEILALSSEYGRTTFLMADNILDLNYLKTVFPELIARGAAIQMFYETKSNLRKDQLELMAAAGVIDIQPGIESLSTAILRLMKKGTSCLQNIQLLKWAEEFGVNVKWNFLYGFPGEDPAEYDKMRARMPLLAHLPPPSGCARIRLDRFSPYWAQPDAYDLRGLRHYWAYDFVYSGLPPEQRARLAYFFEYALPTDADPTAYVSSCVDAINDWRAAYTRGASLEVVAERGAHVIVDSRYDATPTRTAVTDGEWRLLLALDHYRGDADVASIGEGIDGATLSTLIDRGWVICEKGTYLSLVLDRSARNRVVDRRVAIQLSAIGLDGHVSDDVVRPALA